MSNITIIMGDITDQKVDAIVNAANRTLLGGGGVDGAIHRKAGKELLEECKTLNGCKTGEAKITKGYNLPAQFVIHTVGPVWRGGDQNEDVLLSNCYKNALDVAFHHHLSSIAFPSISTGAYRFPLEIASEIAIKAIKSYLQENKTDLKVFVVCFDQTSYNYYIKQSNNHHN